MPAAAWTDERVAILKELWTGGATAQSIADRLGGISRSAVMGKIFRLRLDAETAVLAAAGQSQAGSDDLAQPQSAGRRRRGDKPAAASKVSPPKRRRRRRGKSLLELTNESCRWPQGRPSTPAFFFCGAPGADLERGMPYCERHARRAYRNCESAGEAEKPAGVSTDGLLPDSTPAPARQYVWRPIVRHPALRWR
jgi:GcrA cell cycle regulator